MAISSEIKFNIFYSLLICINFFFGNKKEEQKKRKKRNRKNKITIEQINTTINNLKKISIKNEKKKNFLKK